MPLIRVRLGLIDPEEENCLEGNVGKEGAGASVVSGVDAAPVLEAGEEVLILWRYLSRTRP
jgi:hypothetical protein